MQRETMNRMNRYCFRRRTESALTLAVRLTIRQVSDGICVDEAVQFAAKYHNITCSAIAAELSKSRPYASRMELRCTLPMIPVT
jgi:hypothetical protein